MNTMGTYNYTPVTGYSGKDAFTYQLCDSDNDCSTATVTITINSIVVNQPPVALDDTDTTEFETAKTISILGNDHDPENSTLTVTLCANPYHGTVVINNGGTLTYTPYSGFSGSDSICYTLCDAGIPKLCDEAMVYIEVLAAATAEDLIISKTLTPNGDGCNDVWVIDGIEKFPDNKVKIFNRWGDKIYEGAHYNNINVSWNGTYRNNEFLPDGTYFYILEIKGSKTVKGWIYITDSK
jgi:gliding motility-associated-like protein